MTTLLLETKLHIPPRRAALVGRPELAERLLQGLERPLTLICAPAGYGKTTLLATALTGAAAGTRVAWLSLDEDDNDPVRFWVYVVTALRRVAARIGRESLPLLQSPQSPPLPTVLTLLLNEIAAAPARPLLVLDDYHTIRVPSIHESVTYFLDHLPENARLVVTGRADPPLPLARLRARGQLSEFRAADLRLTAAEAAEFVQSVMGLSLPAEALEVLGARTEGWIAGLQLAALSMREMENPAAFVAAFGGTHRHLVDYLTEEVLARQPPAVAHFLLQSAYLDRFCASLCEAALAPMRWPLPVDAAPSLPHMQALLEYLERVNPFLIPLDGERRWYRYHHLFAEVLRLQAGLVLEPEALRVLHQRAAHWLAENQLWTPAIDHALASGDRLWAGELIARRASAAVARGETATLRAWLAALPEPLARTDDRLSLARAWVELFSGATAVAETWLAPALERVQANASAPDDLRGEALALRATVAFVRADWARVVADTGRALALLSDEQAALRVMLAWHLAFTRRSLGDLARSRELYRQVIELSRRDEQRLIHFSARRELAELRLRQGALLQAQAMLEQLLDEVRGRGLLELASLAGIDLHLAEIAYERNDLVTAEGHLERLLALPAAEAMSFDAHGQALLARVLAALGRPERAAAAMAQAEQRALRAGHALRRTLALDQIARYWLAAGDVARAAAWLPDGRDVPRDPRHEVYARQQLAHAHYFLAAGKRERAMALLDEQLPAAESCGRVPDVVEGWLLRARLHAGEAADVAVGRALQLAEPAGLLRTFLDAGPDVAALLRRVSGRSDVPESYLQRLLGAWPMPAAPGNRRLVEPLSERELEVLRLMARGYSNREIAETLVFTVATAKKHAEHIYGKLGVNSRTRAVARARELDLL